MFSQCVTSFSCVARRVVAATPGEGAAAPSAGREGRHDEKQERQRGWSRPLAQEDDARLAEVLPDGWSDSSGASADSCLTLERTGATELPRPERDSSDSSPRIVNSV